VPLIPGSWPAAAQAASKALAEFLAPAPNGLVGDDNAPLSQKRFRQNSRRLQGQLCFIALLMTKPSR
jgi:hypothetical protein